VLLTNAIKINFNNKCQRCTKLSSVSLPGEEGERGVSRGSGLAQEGLHVTISLPLQNNEHAVKFCSLSARKEEDALAQTY
jgi:hypothetical protein